MTQVLKRVLGPCAKTPRCTQSSKLSEQRHLAGVVVVAGSKRLLTKSLEDEGQGDTLRIRDATLESCTIILMTGTECESARSGAAGLGSCLPPRLPPFLSGCLLVAARAERGG
jgi:hypothetical protein